MHRRLLFLALLACASASAAETQNPKAELKKTERSLKAESSRQQQLEQQTGKVSTELKSLQEELVGLTENLRANQRGLLDAEDKMAILNRQLAEKNTALKEQRARLGAMIQAAIRLSHTPPEAGIMMPGEFDRAALASRVLSTLADSIRRDSQGIALQMTELSDLKRRVQQDQERIDASQSALVQQQQTLDSKLSDRKRLAAQLLLEQQDVKKRMGELSRQAKDLQQLMQSLEKSRQEEEAKARAQPKAAKTAPGKLRPFAPAKGTLAMPVDGRLAQRFGAKAGTNETSKGLLIHAHAKAQVVAPYDGEVVFTGPFLHYGNMVILRHSDGFHTLLAGLDTVAVSVGEFLLEGEPIGVMSESPQGADLYVELRQANQPIDPAPWISGLNH